ncbi:MAG: homoserine kinase [Thermofilaceae archaeon]
MPYIPMYVKAVATASVANIGCLFDAAAMAIEAFADEVTVEEASGDVEVKAWGNVPGGRMNVAYAAAVHFLKRIYGRSRGVRITVKKGVPVGAGLGSSGATAAATVAAINELLGIGAGVGDLIEAAGAGETLAAGTPHYDNVAASLLGGVVLIDPKDPYSHLALEPPEWLRIVLFVRRAPTPAKTQAMRAILPERIDLQEASRWAFAAAMLAVGLTRGVKRCICFASMGGPVEEARSKLVPRYREAKALAVQAGALAFNISGAGPSVFALVEEGREEAVIRALSSVLEGYEPIVSRVAKKGAVYATESRR